MENEPVLTTDPSLLHWIPKYDLKNKPLNDLQTLEQVAIENASNALSKIQLLRELGANPLSYNSKKLFPFHYAKRREIFEALTPPPIQRKSTLVLLARSNAAEDEKILIFRALIQIMEGDFLRSAGFLDAENLTFVGISAKKREFWFVQEVGFTLADCISGCVNTIKGFQNTELEITDYIETLKNNNEIEKEEIIRKQEIAEERLGILTLENETLKAKGLHGDNLLNEQKTEISNLKNRLGILALENETLKAKSLHGDHLLDEQKTEISNLNKGISRKTEKCSLLLAEIDALNNESAKLTKRLSEIKQNLQGLTKKESQNKKEKENLKIQLDNQIKHADLQRAQSEETIHRLQNDKQELQKQLKRARSFEMQAQEQIRQLNNLFGIKSIFYSEKRIKELEDQNNALKTVNTDLESISKKFEQVTSCSLCDEKYESNGERAPVKLKCSHVFCSYCANNWLKSQGGKSSCPSCREPYRCEDIRFVNLNTDL